MPKEIVSLQFGHYSNFIGTHWWNVQETGFNYTEDTPSEINHDILYREGANLKGEVTYTPRLLLVDLKGSLRTLPKDGGLYQSESTSVPIQWNEDAIEVIAENKLEKNPFQTALEEQSTLPKNLDDVKVWSDFLYARFHPRSANIINEYTHESADIPFNIHQLGLNLWKESHFVEEFCDKLRNYMEECDCLQGFHVTTDVTDGFGGLTQSCLEYLSDEYDKKSVLTMAAIPAWYSDYNYNNSEDREKSTRKDYIRMINLAMSFEGLSTNSSLVLPICMGSKGWKQPGPKREFKYLNYNANQHYHTSAILASALDTLTMPYRLKSSHFTLNDFCSDLSNYGRKIAATSLNLPFPLTKGSDLIDLLDNWDGSLWESITPSCHIGDDKIMRIITARGIRENQLKQPLHKATKQRGMPAYQFDTVEEMIKYYLQCTTFASANHVTSLATPLSVKTPYPNLFNEFVGEGGEILRIPKENNQGVQNVPLIAGVHSGTMIGDMIDSLHRETSRIKFARFPQLLAAGLESTEYSESLNRLLELRECYEESFE